MAHRDVLVMTLASSAGIVAAAGHPRAHGAIFGGGRRSDNNGAGAFGFLIALVVSLVVRDQLLPHRLLSLLASCPRTAPAPS